MDKFCAYCSEAVTEEHRVHELHNTYCCDSDECERELNMELRAADEAAEYRARNDGFNRYR